MVVVSGRRANSIPRKWGKFACKATHVLDAAHGKPAGVVDVTLYRCTSDCYEMLKSLTTNAERTLRARLGGSLRISRQSQLRSLPMPRSGRCVIKSPNQ